MPRLRDRARFDAWFDRIVVHRCQDRLRRRRLHPLTMDGPDPAVSDATDRAAAIAAIAAQTNSGAARMTGSATSVSRSVESIAAVSEENSASAEEVSAATEELPAQVEEVVASASSLADMARSLDGLVARFRLDGEAGAVVQRRRSSDWQRGRGTATPGTRVA